ncbi:uncharacterized protein LOC135704787 [Ochlerotatus camptorhynchus]|uniref:uncharacterized protein LOC135704787 n=1 Tax=Ochlerotatus camptorhynchus TaxID=644619 RepID=UPI0031D24B0E
MGLESKCCFTRSRRSWTRAWEGRQKKGVYPNYEATIEFLQEQFRIMEKININTKPLVESAKVKPVNKCHTLVATNEHKHELKCVMCKNNHELWKCDKFKELNVSEKYSSLKKWGSCFNCSQRGHRTSGCSSSHNCRDCGKRHHTLLHSGSVPNRVPVESTTNVNDESKAAPSSSKKPDAVQLESATTLCVSAAIPSKQTLLSTAVVMVNGGSSAHYPCRVLLDSASQLHFVTERFANLLSQQKQPIDYLVSGLNGSNIRLRNMIRTTVKSRNGAFAAELEFLIAPRITGDVPVKSFDVSNWPMPEGIELADPAFNKRGRIDMLIGAEIFWDLVQNDRIRLAPNLPVFTKTEFGWIAGGVLAKESPVIARSLCLIAGDERLEDILKNFYRLEACDVNRTSFSKSDQDCLEHFKCTHVRNKDGRYFVRHPFNDKKNELGDSREMATQRFLNLERRLDKQPELKQQYCDFIDEYERLGHLRVVEIDKTEKPGSVFYLPHHCILKPTSTTTKLRVVFDGSI